MKSNTQKIKFKKVGRDHKHTVTLFGLGKRPFDITAPQSEQSFAEESLTHYHTQALEYLKSRGFDDPQGWFQIINGKIKRWTEGADHPANAMPLWAAIEKRDKTRGQTGEYLAALIDHKCRTLLNGGWPPRPQDHSAVLDQAMFIQILAFDLYLLENVQPAYSGGKARGKNGDSMKRQFLADAEKYYIEAILEDGRDQSGAYIQAAEKIREDENKNLRHDVKTPTVSAIASWFKHRPDLKKEVLRDRKKKNPT